MSSEPSPEEIARVEEWQKAQERTAQIDARRRREEQAAEIQQRLANALVGKTVERVESDSDYLYKFGGADSYNAFDFALLFTDGSSVAFEGNYDSRALTLTVKPSSNPE